MGNAGGAQEFLGATLWGLSGDAVSPVFAIHGAGVWLKKTLGKQTESLAPSYSFFFFCSSRHTRLASLPLPPLLLPLPLPLVAAGTRGSGQGLREGFVFPHPVNLILFF